MKERGRRRYLISLRDYLEEVGELYDLFIDCYDLDDRDIMSRSLTTYDAFVILYLLLGWHRYDDVLDYFMEKYVQDIQIEDFIFEAKQVFDRLLTEIYGDEYDYRFIRFYPMPVELGVDLYIFTDSFLYEIDQKDYPFPYWMYRSIG